MHTRATTTTTFGPADIQSLFDGHLEGFRNDLTATTVHLYNHRYDMDQAIRERWTDALKQLQDAVESLHCEHCRKAAVTTRAGEPHCADCALMWAECENCHEDTLIADLGSTGQSDALLCPGCLGEGDE